MSDICKVLYSGGTTHGHQAADKNVIKDQDFEGDRDSDLEHDRDLSLERNNQDDPEGSSKNDNQDLDNNLMEHEDNQMDHDQFPHQQEDEVDHFNDGLKGEMQAYFDQGNNDEPNNAARWKSQEVTHKEDIQKHVITAATKLLKTGGYLCIPDLSNGKWKIFVLQALMDSCLAFYYSNSKKALKNTDEFHHTIPLNMLILMAAVMKGVISGFSETGTNKVPDLSADRCRNNLNLLQKSLDKLMDILKHCDELEDMLAQ
ncbi:hypothetical protein BDR06DRAFT_1013725 [Suillus hirtellus]|nr:hypothetical protein BDR06DRAFT_1013725 [Suillus hirtellus]